MFALLDTTSNVIIDEIVEGDQITTIHLGQIIHIWAYYSVRHFWQVLYTLCIVTETSWKISDIGSDNFQMISVIFHMMFGKWQIHVKSFFAHNVFPGPDTKKQKRLRSLELNVLPGARTRFLIAFIFYDLRQKEWFLVN